MQTHQQRNFYPLNLNPGTSQNNPYTYAQNPDINNPNNANPEYLASAANQSGTPYENILNRMAYASSQKRNQDTMAGMPSHGARGMQLNYGAGESTSVVTCSPSFQSPNSYFQLQSGGSGFEFSGQGSIELQQFNQHSSIPVGFHELPSSGIAQVNVEGESAQGKQTHGVTIFMGQVLFPSLIDTIAIQ